MTELPEAICPDLGACHHGCTPGLECWRTRHAAPLSITHWTEWPDIAALPNPARLRQRAGDLRRDAMRARQSAAYADSAQAQDVALRRADDARRAAHELEVLAWRLERGDGPKPSSQEANP